MHLCFGCGFYGITALCVLNYSKNYVKTCVHAHPIHMCCVYWTPKWIDPHEEKRKIFSSFFSPTKWMNDMIVWCYKNHILEMIACKMHKQTPIFGMYNVMCGMNWHDFVFLMVLYLWVCQRNYSKLSLDVSSKEKNAKEKHHQTYHRKAIEYSAKRLHRKIMKNSSHKPNIIKYIHFFSFPFVIAFSVH